MGRKEIYNTPLIPKGQGFLLYKKRYEFFSMHEHKVLKGLVNESLFCVNLIVMIGSMILDFHFYYLQFWRFL